jgi:hypothetical protein
MGTIGAGSLQWDLKCEGYREGKYGNIGSAIV